jgi:predicted small metal-binding protein
MATVACRDTGIECDWSNHSDDPGLLLIELIKHAESEHPDVFGSAIKKYKVWELLLQEYKFVRK